MKTNSIEKITIHSWFNLAECGYPYETYEFNIDFKNSTAQFDAKEILDYKIRSMPFEENRNVFNKINEFYSEELFELNDIDMNEVISSIADLRRYCEDDSNLDTNLAYMVFYIIEIHYFNQEYEYIECLNECFPELKNLSDVIKKLVGFDVFNLDNIKGLVTDYNYKISENYITDRDTGEKLVLKKLFYSKNSGAFFESSEHNFKIDFDKMELKTSDDKKIKLNSKDLDEITNLIKKYGIFKWNSIEYSTKAINEHIFTLDGGGRWKLCLVFDGGQILNFGGCEDYHDTYVEFGKGLENLFGIDLLDVADLIN